MAKEENIHAGHRERLYETVFNVGLAGLSSIQALEYILCYIFPRGDVNPLAHRLLDRFKGISFVLDADINDLASVKGMGRVSAMKLKGLVEIFNIYTTSKVSKDSAFSTYGDIYDYAESLLRYKTTEELYVFGFNSSGNYVADRCLAKGTLKIVGIEMRDISNFVNTYKVPVIVIAHNHPGGSCIASFQDLSTHESLVRKFEFTGCTIKDNIIIGVDGIYSLESGTMKRIFRDNQKYDEIEKVIMDADMKKNK